MARASEFQPGDVLQIEWTDAHSHDPWMPGTPEVMALACSPAECVTVGFFRRKDDKVLAVSHTQAKDGDVCGMMVIPHGFISKVTKLRAAK